MALQLRILTQVMSHSCLHHHLFFPSKTGLVSILWAFFGNCNKLQSCQEYVCVKIITVISAPKRKD